MAKVWIVSVDNSIAPLVELGRGFGGELHGVSLGESLHGVDALTTIDVTEGVPGEAYAPVVASAVQAQPGDVVLVANRPLERVFAGAIAAAAGAGVVRSVSSLKPGLAEVGRFGGISVEDYEFTAPLVILVDPGAAAEGESPAAASATGEPYAASVSSVEASGTASANLASAKRIVSIGRGLKTAEDLAMVRELADTLGAELACSRPLAEGTGWVARDRYVGVSGANVSPDLYLAAGISGQVQHTAGMSSSKVIVAINTDDKAPIFEIADYGIVGDIYEVLPALNAAAK